MNVMYDGEEYQLSLPSVYVIDTREVTAARPVRKLEQPWNAFFQGQSNDQSLKEHIKGCPTNFVNRVSHGFWPQHV